MNLNLNEHTSKPCGEQRFCEMKTIKRQTRILAEEKLCFLEGKSIGEVDIFIESGENRRKVRRIIEKRVCQNLHRHRWASMSGNSYRYNQKHRVSNHLKNLYGRPSLEIAQYWS